MVSELFFFELSALPSRTRVSLHTRIGEAVVLN